MRKTTKTIWLLVFVLAINFLSTTSVYALSIGVYVPEKYTEVIAGERFYFEIEIKYPENPQRKDLRLEYQILKDDKVIAQSKVLKAIETQASFMDYIVTPESADGGIHKINIVITDYEDLKEEVSANFHVVGNKWEQLSMYFFILLSVVFLVGALVVISIIISGKKR